MPSREKLLERARVAKAGWRFHELERLYLAFEFEQESGGKHVLFSHRKYRQLSATVTRSSGDLPTGYVATAVKLIDAALALAEQEKHDGK